MASFTVTRNKTLPDSADKSDFHGLIDGSDGLSITVTSIADSEVQALDSGSEGEMLYHSGTAWTDLSKGTAYQQLRMNSGATAPEWATQEGTINYVIGDGVNEIETGVAGGIIVDVASTITSATVLALDGNTGSVVIDIWKDTYANFPPTVADTITAAAKPTISSATKATDATLTGWTTAITAGDILFFNVDSCTTLTKVLVSLQISKNQ